jgi:hypothetical protein
MTMFSMKPKFNLAEFLAEPAKPNTSRRRSKMNYAPAAASAEDVAPDEATAPAAPKKPAP